jgi:uncharacterized protein YceK
MRKMFVVLMTLMLLGSGCISLYATQAHNPSSVVAENGAEGGEG